MFMCYTLKEHYDRKMKSTVMSPFVYADSTFLVPIFT